MSTEPLGQDRRPNALCLRHELPGDQPQHIEVILEAVSDEDTPRCLLQAFELLFPMKPASIVDDADLDNFPTRSNKLS